MKNMIPTKNLGKLDFIKVKNFFSLINTAKRRKRQATNEEKIFVNMLCWTDCGETVILIVLI